MCVYVRACVCTHVYVIPKWVNEWVPVSVCVRLSPLLSPATRDRRPRWRRAGGVFDNSIAPSQRPGCHGNTLGGRGGEVTVGGGKREREKKKGGCGRLGSVSNHTCGVRKLNENSYFLWKLYNDLIHFFTHKCRMYKYWLMTVVTQLFVKKTIYSHTPACIVMQ